MFSFSRFLTRFVSFSVVEGDALIKLTTWKSVAGDSSALVSKIQIYIDGHAPIHNFIFKNVSARGVTTCSHNWFFNILTTTINDRRVSPAITTDPKNIVAPARIWSIASVYENKEKK